MPRPSIASRFVPGPTEFDSFSQVENAARRRLPATLFEDLMGGVGRSVTARANVAAFDEVTFRTRSGVAWPQRDLATTVLGTPVTMPVLLGPVGGLRMTNPEGGVGAARAAARAGTVSVLSMSAGHGPQDVAAASTGPCWQQLYLSRGRERAERLIAEASECGFQALVVTVDCPVSPKKPVHLSISWRSAVTFGPELVRRPHWTAAFLRDGASLAAANDALGPRTNETAVWADLQWIKQVWAGPLVVKGVTTADDARRAVDGGADAVVVSNHGGLTLDGAPATISVLPAIVAAVGSTAEVYLDGGIRQGTDVLKAMAMGARAVLLGRAYAAALAAGGEAGVTALLAMFRHQLDTGLAMLGCPSITALDASYVTVPPHWQAA